MVLCVCSYKGIGNRFPVNCFGVEEENCRVALPGKEKSFVGSVLSSCCVCLSLLQRYYIAVQVDELHVSPVVVEVGE